MSLLLQTNGSLAGVRPDDLAAATLRGLVDRLAALDGVQKDDNSDLHFFYSNVKRFTVQAYTTSQYFLTKVQVYELVPGRYHGCIPIKPSPQVPL